MKNVSIQCLIYRFFAAIILKKVFFTVMVAKYEFSQWLLSDCVVLTTRKYIKEKKIKKAKSEFENTDHLHRSYSQRKGEKESHNFCNISFVSWTH